MEKIQGDPIEAIGGPTLGADPLVGAIAALSFKEGRPLNTFIIRKQPKSHGKQQQVEGPLLKEGSRVLDAGTGSGILAIYAVMSGAKRVTAFDNDPLAVENALENFKLNSVQDKIDVFCGELEQIRSEKFPLILANINRNVLLQLAKDFYSRASDAGLLILSGLLQEDFEQINNQYIKNGWRLLDQKREGEWLALVFEKDGTSV